MATTTCLVKVRSYGYTYTARAGSGKTAVNASCTAAADQAARRAGARYLGVPENAVTAVQQDGKSERLDFGPNIWIVSILEDQGGAS